MTSEYKWEITEIQENDSPTVLLNFCVEAYTNLVELFEYAGATDGYVVANELMVRVEDLYIKFMKAGEEE